MFSVSLIGPDGCGKSTISKRILAETSFETKRIYMGTNHAESNYALPTTRFILWIRRLLKKEVEQGGPRDMSKETKSKSKNPIKRAFKELRSGLVLLNIIAEEWYRQSVTWYFIWRGKIVVFDRHFYVDYYHYDVNGRDPSWTSRIHGYMLDHIYPKPDLVIYLDAPAEELFSRKGEGTIELLEERKQNYLDMHDKVPHFEIVSASQSIEDVYSDVLKIIIDFKQSKQLKEQSYG